MCAVPTTRDYLVKELKPDPDCNFNLVRMSDACREEDPVKLILLRT
jgi:hypothetical protein